MEGVLQKARCYFGCKLVMFQILFDFTVRIFKCDKYFKKFLIIYSSTCLNMENYLINMRNKESFYGKNFNLGGVFGHFSAFSDSMDIVDNLI